MLCALFGSRAFFFPSGKEENMTNRKYNERMRVLTLTAMFCAIAYVVMFVLKISGIGGFLTFDVKDAIIAAAAMLLGPAAGAVISFIDASIQITAIRMAPTKPSPSSSIVTSSRTAAPLIRKNTQAIGIRRIPIPQLSI